MLSGFLNLMLSLGLAVLAWLLFQWLGEYMFPLMLGITVVVLIQRSKGPKFGKSFFSASMVGGIGPLIRAGRVVGWRSGCP